MRDLMGSIQTLTRLNQLALDQLRLRISDLLQQQQRLNEALSDLNQREQTERQWTSQQIDKALTHHAFIKKISLDRSEINTRLAKIEEEISTLMTELQEHFYERKRYEIVSKNQQTLQNKQEQKLEQKLLDDLASRKRRINQ